MSSIQVEIDLDDVLYQAEVQAVVDHFDSDELLDCVALNTIINHYDPKNLFQAIDAHVKGGTDPQFNQAYNQWRNNK